MEFMEIEHSQNGLERVCTQNGHIKDPTAAQAGQPSPRKGSWGRACTHSEMSHVTHTRCHLTSRYKGPCGGLCDTELEGSHLSQEMSNWKTGTAREGCH